MFGERLKELREGRKISQRELAKALNISPSSVAMYELNQRSPDKEMISLMSTFFHVPTDYLLGLTNNPKPYKSNAPLGEEKSSELPLGEVKKIPIYSLKPINRDEIFAPENIIGWQPVPADTMATIAIKIDDDSMSGSRINKGDLVIIQQQQTFTNGQTLFVQLPDRSLIIRKATRTNDGVILYPDNSAYQPQYFNLEDITVIGVVIQVIFDYI